MSEHITMLLIGQLQMAVSESFEDVAHMLGQEDRRFVLVTDAVSGKRWGVAVGEIGVFRQASPNEENEIRSVRAQHAGIAIPNNDMSHFPRPGGKS